MQGWVRFPPGSPGSADVQSQPQHSRLSLPIHRPERGWHCPGAFSWLCRLLQGSCAASGQIPVVGCRLQTPPSHFLSSVINRTCSLSLIISRCRTRGGASVSGFGCVRWRKDGVCQTPRPDPVGKSSQLRSGFHENSGQGFQVHLWPRWSTEWEWEPGAGSSQRSILWEWDH